MIEEHSKVMETMRPVCREQKMQRQEPKGSTAWQSDGNDATCMSGVENAAARAEREYCMAK